jgi:hypothetical protein
MGSRAGIRSARREWRLRYKTKQLRVKFKNALKPEPYLDSRRYRRRIGNAIAAFPVNFRWRYSETLEKFLEGEQSAETTVSKIEQIAKQLTQ